MTSAVAEAAARAADLSQRVDVASARVLATAAGITEEMAREPSSLPGWSRGHVLTHIARNADGLRNLLIWARTGVVTPQYADIGERERGIAAGAGRSARGEPHGFLAEQVQVGGPQILSCHRAHGADQRVEPNIEFVKSYDEH